MSKNNDNWEGEGEMRDNQDLDVEEAAEGTVKQSNQATRCSIWTLLPPCKHTEPENPSLNAEFPTIQPTKPDPTNSKKASKTPQSSQKIDFTSKHLITNLSDPAPNPLKTSENASVSIKLDDPQKTKSKLFLPNAFLQ